MDLKTYLVANTQTDLARRLGVTQGLVHQWATGKTQVTAKRAVKIEEETQGAVTRKDLRPDDWHLIWPELLTHDSPTDQRDKSNQTI